MLTPSSLSSNSFNKQDLRIEHCGWCWENRNQRHCSASQKQLLTQTEWRHPPQLRKSQFWIFKYNMFILKEDRVIKYDCGISIYCLVLGKVTHSVFKNPHLRTIFHCIFRERGREGETSMPERSIDGLPPLPADWWSSIRVWTGMSVPGPGILRTHSGD